MNLISNCRLVRSFFKCSVGHYRRSILTDFNNTVHTSTTAFFVSTVVLGVQNTDLVKEIEKLKEPSKLAEMDRFLLPKTVRPIHYDLYLHPHLESGLFDGVLTATVNVEQEDDKVFIHANGLGIHSVKYGTIDCDFEIDKAHELIIIKLPSKLARGSAKFTIKYFGDMKNRIVGLYQSRYTKADGTKTAIATSKFEPTYARQAFPCFDEPNLKANYTVHLVKPKDKNYIALSNMPQESEEEVADGVLVNFQTSVKMSTYLTCFIVSDFKYKETIIHPDSDKIPLRVYSSPDNVEKTSYALEVGKKVIEYYLQYFKIKYPLPKLDLVAIPDFVSGAMEHWGLVTFRETALLFDPQTSSSSNQLRVATVVAHELAHSWFGNLVTMDWWNDLWLNEGFATYIEYKGIDYVHKDWQMTDLFVLDVLHSVLKIDSTTASHPIVVHVKTPNQITEIFDSITYNKGSSILRMLEDTVGPDNFQKATTNYLNNHLFGNAVTKNYFDEVQNVVGSQMDIYEFMNTFTEQSGLPILDVVLEGDKFVVTQKHFLKQADPSKLRSSKYNYKWTVPVTFVTDLNSTKREMVWFKHNQNQITIPKPQGSKWVKFNHNQMGYYRVNYSPEYWKLLQENIKDMTISDRTHLMEESFSIAEAGQLTYKVPLSFTKYLSSEKTYFVWNVVLSKFNNLNLYLEGSPAYDKFKKYFSSLVFPIYEEMSDWTVDVKDPYPKKMLKHVIYSLALKLDNDHSIKMVNELFSNWISGNGFIPQDLKTVVYNYGIRKGTNENWNKLWDKFVSELDASEKLKLMSGLAQSQDVNILKELINRAKDETYVRSQDYFTLLSHISSNKMGRELVWGYVRDNWEYLINRFGLNERYLGRLIPSITQSFTTEEKLNEMKAFFEKYPEAGAGAAARLEALEYVKSNIAWVKKNKAEVEAWIQENA